MELPKDKNGRELSLGDMCTNGTRYFKIEVMEEIKYNDAQTYTIYDGTGWIYYPKNIEKL